MAQHWIGPEVDGCRAQNDKFEKRKVEQYMNIWTVYDFQRRLITIKHQLGSTIWPDAGRHDVWGSGPYGRAMSTVDLAVVGNGM